MRYLLLAAVLLSGCAETQIVPGPNGVPLARITCRRSSDCIDEAWEQCPNGYDVMGQDSQVTGVTATSSYGVTNVNVKRQNELLVQCRGR